MIQVTWGNTEKTRLIMKFGVRWSRSEFWTASKSARNMMLSVEHSVDLLADMTLSFSTPRNVIHLVLSGMRTKTDNLGKVVVVSPTNLWLRLYQYIERAYPMDAIPVKFVETDAEAMEILNNYTSTTKDSLPSDSGSSVSPFTNYSFV